MRLENIVNAVVSQNTRGITQRGFGTPQVIGVHTNTQEIVKEYDTATILSDLVTDGFSANDPIYRTCASVAANPTKPPSIKVGKLATAFNQTFTITVADNVETDKIYAFDLISPAGVVTAISYTAIVTDDRTDVAAALAALITAVTDITAVAVATEVITCTADNANEMWLCADINPLDLQFEETTVDSNLATEIAANDAVDSDYYALYLADPNSEARITALAAYIETQEKIFGATTHDYICLDSTSTDDAMYNTNAASYNRTYVIFSGYQERKAAATWGGSRLPFNPGSQTWAYKELPSVEVDDNLTSAFMSAMRVKKGNYYVPVQGVNLTFEGRMASGEWIDIIRGRDHFVQGCRERILQLLATVQKIPFTDAGIAQVVAQLRAQVAQSTAFGYLDPEREAVYNFPEAANVSAANKANRILPDISVEVYLAGAIHIIDPLTLVVSL